MARPQTISDDFNDSYAEAGLQPSVGSIRNVNVGRKKAANDPSLKRDGLPNNNVRSINNGAVRNIKTYGDQSFQQTASNDTSYHVKKEDKNKTRNVQVETAPPKRERVRPANLKLKLRRKNRLAQKLEARMKVMGINKAVFSIGGTLWLTVQLPFAILNSVLLGISLAVYSFIEYSPTVGEEDGLAMTGAKTLLGWGFGGLRYLTDIAQAASNTLLGFNIFSFVAPLTYFFVTWFVLFFFTIGLIFTMYIAYKLRGLEPLAGKGIVLKYGAFLLTFIGHSLPIVNMFPWFMVWAGAVWLKPK
jgi:hypothetical protein